MKIYPREEDANNEFDSINSDNAAYSKKDDLPEFTTEEQTEFINLFFDVSSFQNEVDNIEKEDFHLIYGVEEGEKFWHEWMVSDLDLSTFAAQNMTNKEFEELAQFLKDRL